MSQYRLKRGPVLVLLLVVGVVGAFLIARSTARPALEALAPVTVPMAYEGTTYAFDGLVCLRAGAFGERVTEVSGSGGAVRTSLALRPAGAPLTVAFPVPDGASADLVGLELDAGEEQCVRVLATPAAQGEGRGGPVEVRFSYGPLGVLRSGLTVTPPVVLQVTGTGTDPRSEA